MSQAYMQTFHAPFYNKFGFFSDNGGQQGESEKAPESATEAVDDGRFLLA